MYFLCTLAVRVVIRASSDVEKRHPGSWKPVASLHDTLTLRAFVLALSGVEKDTQDDGNPSMQPKLHFYWCDPCEIVCSCVEWFRIMTSWVMV